LLAACVVIALAVRSRIALTDHALKLVSFMLCLPTAFTVVANRFVQLMPLMLNVP